jgi:hypothetical protein
VAGHLEYVCDDPCLCDHAPCFHRVDGRGRVACLECGQGPAAMDRLTDLLATDGVSLLISRDYTVATCAEHGCRG